MIQSIHLTPGTFYELIHYSNQPIRSLVTASIDWVHVVYSGLPKKKDQQKTPLVALNEKLACSDPTFLRDSRPCTLPHFFNYQTETCNAYFYVTNIKAKIVSYGVAKLAKHMLVLVQGKHKVFLLWG